MSRRTQKHANQRLAFDARDSRERRLAACKRFLRLEGDMIRMRHRGGESGLRIARARSGVIDVLIERLFEPVRIQLPTGDDDPRVALVALGGYGRQELCPLSDIDIMFLYPSDVRGPALKQTQELLTDQILYILWDLGLKVGHSFRSIDEAIQEARKDILTKTALLEARLITGTATTFEAFQQAYRNDYLKENAREYIAQRLEDQKLRRAKYGDTVFLQEPDIKNGVGGLRDYQNTVWMARVKLGVNSLDELIPRNLLTEAELRDFDRAYNFLLRVRNELHFSSKRATDILHLEKQPRIAAALGYDDRDYVTRIEKFMRDYYRCAQTIYRTSRLLERRLALRPDENGNDKITFREVLRARRLERTRRLDGFVLRGRELTSENDDVFAEDPVRLIRVFRHCQQLGCKPDLELVNLIRNSTHLLTPKIVSTPEACRSFRAILSDVGRVYKSLYAMHELGVLERIIPEWEHITCLVQHEHYHRYTADVHTLHTIRELDRVFTDPDPIYERYRREIHEAVQPDLLYPVLLLHDIGKAEGIKNHAESGARIADPILARLGFNEELRAIAHFLIKNHLTMARFWQKYDLDDPQTTAAFAEIVGDADRLRHLFVHTFCDARGTASGLWNSYKDTLHTTLFSNTLAYLKHGGAVHHHEARRFEMTKQDLLSRDLGEISRDEVEAHFSLLPERYFIYTDNDEIALHLRMVHQLLKTIITTDAVGSLHPIIDWRDDLERSLTVVNIVTWDRAGLFYKLAGALSLAGLNILSAKVMSRSDHIAIDTFHVVAPGRGVVQSQRVMDAFQKNVDAALISNRDLLPEIQDLARKNRDRLFGNDDNPLLHSFTPRVDVYHELSLKRTIVEVQAPDQIGLLYLLSKAITEAGFDITFARVNTERGLAIDTFYIEPSG
ncbi:MAG: [protein-PII] uridylyltransferase, partial [Verrucomicrobia bacterium]